MLTVTLARTLILTLARARTLTLVRARALTLALALALTLARQVVHAFMCPRARAAPLCVWAVDWRRGLNTQL